MARRLSAVLLLFAASFASAQTTTGNSITVTETNDSDRIINIAECKGGEQDKLNFSWTYTGWSSSVPGSYRLTLSDQSGCPSSAHLQVYGNISATASTGAYPSSTDPTIGVPTLLGALSIACTSSATAIYVCVDFVPSTSGSVTSAATGTVTLDLATPPAPVVATPTPGDGALNISWSAGSGSTDTNTTGTSSNYDVIVTNPADPNEKHDPVTTFNTSTRIGNLQNGVTYNVVVRAFSPGGNQSDDSNVVSGTPVQVEDFWRLYRAAGGKETGGCAPGSAGAVALMALVPLVLRRRRRS